MAASPAKADLKQPSTTYPTPSPTPPSTTTKIAATVQTRIAAAVSTSGAPPLTSAKHEKYDFEKQLRTAEDKLLEDKREEAQLILNEILDCLCYLS